MLGPFFMIYSIMGDSNILIMPDTLTGTLNDPLTGLKYDANCTCKQIEKDPHDCFPTNVDVKYGDSNNYVQLGNNDPSHLPLLKTKYMKMMQSVPTKILQERVLCSDGFNKNKGLF